MCEPLYADSFSWSEYAFMGPLGFVMAALFILCIREMVIYRVIVDDDGIRLVSTFSKRSLRISEIKGFTIEGEYLRILPNTAARKRISIGGYSYIGHYKELLHWLEERTVNLDKQEQEQEEVKILSDERFGIDEPERIVNMRNADRTARIIKIVALLLAAWGFFIRYPYKLSTAANIIWPLVALTVAKLSGGRIMTTMRKNSPYPNVALALYMCSFCLLYRTICAVNYYHYGNLWLPVVAFTAVATYVCTIGTKEFTIHQHRWYDVYLQAIAWTAMLGWGAFAFFNCGFDRSEPTIYTAAVTDMRTSGTAGYNYLMSLTAWGDHRNGEEVPVGRNVYKQTKEGDTVVVCVKKGRLGAPWFYVKVRE